MAVANEQLLNERKRSSRVTDAYSDVRCRMTEEVRCVVPHRLRVRAGEGVDARGVVGKEELHESVDVVGARFGGNARELLDDVVLNVARDAGKLRDQTAVNVMPVLAEARAVDMRRAHENRNALDHRLTSPIAVCRGPCGAVRAASDARPACSPEARWNATSGERPGHWSCVHAAPVERAHGVGSIGAEGVRHVAVDVERVALSVRVGRRAEEVAARKKRRTDLETQDVWPQPMSITRLDLRSGVAARSARRVSDARARERVGGRGELQGTKGDERVGAIAECARRAHTPRDDVLASQGAVDAGRREINTAVAVERVEAFPTAVARIRIAAPALVFDGETRRSAAGKRV